MRLLPGALLIVTLVFRMVSAAQPADLDGQLKLLEEAAEAGTIASRLSEIEDIKALLGEPQKEQTIDRGDRTFILFDYKTGLQLSFVKNKNSEIPYVLFMAGSEKGNLDLGENRRITLRDQNDLKKMDSFWGLANVSLRKLDLRDKSEYLDSMNFDSNTLWPEASMLPEGFDPAAILEEGKNPGLGIRGLHERGIDGSGVGIAIIDQPLLLGHREYTAKLLRYDATGLRGFPVAMHGAPVASIAAGDNLGVAPGAALTFFAVPNWKRDNVVYIDALEKIFAMNVSLPDSEKIRVISISSGMFPHFPNYDRWQEVTRRADSLGICLVTCLMDSLKYGMLRAVPGADHDNPANYEKGMYTSEKDELRVPTGNITVASHRGIDCYTFYRNGGLSWAAPYIAGVAALGYQVNPDIRPAQILRLLKETATTTDAGPVINPVAFVEKAAQAAKLSGDPGRQ